MWHPFSREQLVEPNPSPPCTFSSLTFRFDQKLQGRSHLNFQIPKPYSNLGVRFCPTIAEVAPKITPWLHLWDEKKVRGNPSLDTQSCIRDFWWHGISVFGPFGSQYSTEKKVWADYEQLLRSVFYGFVGKFFFENILASELKSCINFWYFYQAQSHCI